MQQSTRDIAALKQALEAKVSKVVRQGAKRGRNLHHLNAVATLLATKTLGQSVRVEVKTPCDGDNAYPCVIKWYEGGHGPNFLQTLRFFIEEE